MSFLIPMRVGQHPKHPRMSLKPMQYGLVDSGWSTAQVNNVDDMFRFMRQFPQARMPAWSRLEYEGAIWLLLGAWA